MSEHGRGRGGRGRGGGGRGRGRGGGRGGGSGKEMERETKVFERESSCDKRGGARNRGRGNGENNFSNRGRGASSGNNGERRIGYHLLKSWSENENGDELLIHISNKLQMLEEELKKDSMKSDWYELLVKSFVNVFKSKHQTQKLKKVLLMVSQSHFLNLYLTNYLDQKQLQVVNWTEGEEFFVHVTEIIKQIVKHLPDQIPRCKLAITILQTSAQGMSSLLDNEELQNIISSILSTISEAQKVRIEKEATRQLAAKRFVLPSADNETPPDYFKDLSVIPTVEDLFAKEKPFLRAIIVKGVYKDQEHYLDVQFRLTREDFFKPLRDGIQEFRDHGGKNKFISSDIRIYRDVHFTGMTTVNGITHVVQFDVKKLKNIRWDHSKRLLTGNLLCLSNDDFTKTLIFATVSFRDTEQLKKGILNITCHSGLDVILKATSNDTFLMAETMAYYEAVNPILKGLQTIDSDLPLKDYIISCKKTLKPPSYLLGSVRKYDISSLMKPIKKTPVSVLNTMSWPKSEDMCLNSSQRDAAILALTKELSVIQGPPGTGKTYVGLKVMEVLLKNQDERASNEYGEDYDPILVICYTNHALDQFLEGILQFCHDGIIRIGGKSSSELLKPFNLLNVKRKHRSQSGAFKYSISQLYRAMDDFSSDISKVHKLLENASNNILSEDILSDCISPQHYQDLIQGNGIFVGGKRKKTSKISQWLNASDSSMIEDLPKMIKYHLTRVVMTCINHFQKTKISNYTFKAKANILERVKFYSIWLFQYKYALQLKIRSMQVDPITANRISSMAFRPNILSDNEISSALPLKVYQQIVKYLQEFDLDFVEGYNFIEAWVLGLHHSQKKQMDEYEQLVNYLEKVESKKTGQDDDDNDFDEDEEVEIAKSRRLLFDDDSEEKNILQATLKVENEDEFLMNRAKLLGITEIEDEGENEDKKYHEDADGFRTVTHKKHVSSAKVGKILTDETFLPLAEEEEGTIFNLWELDMQTKFGLYKLWVKKYKDTLIEKIEDLLKQYNDTKEELQETRMKEDIDVLKQAKVIGMTTTGAAKKRALLEAIGCRIIIVEEAAEVLESHIVTALNQNCKHLILIGDHQQLRPNPTVYEHAKHFNLDISLFERLVKNDIPHVTLQEQHRMRESISIIMRHIYPNLEDHESVKKYENIQGVSKNIFFIQHYNLESSVNDSLSKSNLFEAEYVIRLCKYFLLQGYQTSQITILATYAGQVLEIKKQSVQQKLQRGVRITAVDNFQGEENDIILLSLVRSNERNSVGFLKVDNRVCVALSRAKKGFFAIGNFDLLAKQSKLWEKIKQTAVKEKITGDGLPVACPNHPDEKTIMRLPTDFDARPQGGCNKPCDFRLNCGHVCHLKCHGYNLKHKDFKCLSLCAKTCSKGHPCKDKCWQKCGKCMTLEDKVIPACGHSNKLACHIIPKETDCTNQCDHYLDCGHQCGGKCGECKKSNLHKKCGVLVTYFWPCDHEMKVPCYMKPDKYPCPKKCNHQLECGHKCKGKCSECLNGAVHVACTEKCEKKMPCGHKCQSFCGVACPPCSFPCSTMCNHGPCSHKNKPRACGKPCLPCQENCGILRFCVHKKCNLKCFEICEGGRCDQLCQKTVKRCGHPCASLCGERCICKLCEKVSSCSNGDTKDETSAGKDLPGAEKDTHVDASESKDIDPNQTVEMDQEMKVPDALCGVEENLSKSLATGLKIQGEENESTDKTKSKTDHQDAVLIKLHVCGHIFVLNEIDEYVSNFVLNSTTELIGCPTCHAPIQMSSYFDKILKKRANDRELMKKSVYESNKITTSQVDMIGKSWRELQDKDQNLTWFDWRHIEEELPKNLSEFETIACKLKFAFVINEIRSLDQTSVSEIDKTLDKRVGPLLNIKKGMTMNCQQIKEYREDLRRLFILKYVKVLENFASNHGIKEFDKEKKSKVMEQLKSLPATSDAITQGIQLIVEMEADIGDCSDSSVHAVLVIKKRIARRILKVLKAENTKMLSEVLYSSTLSSYASGTNLFSSKGASASSLTPSRKASNLSLSSATKSSLYNRPLTANKPSTTLKPPITPRSSIASKPSSTLKLLSEIRQSSQTESLPSSSGAKTKDTEEKSPLSKFLGRLMSKKE